MTTILTDANFEAEPAVGIVLVYGWAPTCGLCRAQQAPVVTKLAEELAGRLRVGTLHVDEHPRVRRRLGVDVLPMFWVFRDGREQLRLKGFKNREKLLEALAPLLPP